MKNVTFIALSASLVASCQVSPALAGEFSVTTLIASYHFDREANYNESNPGIGINYRYNQEYSVGVGTYKNSFSKTSTYVFGGVTFAQSNTQSFGVVGGFITGYTSNIAGAFVYSRTVSEHVSIDVYSIPISGGGFGLGLTFK